MNAVGITRATGAARLGFLLCLSALAGLAGAAGCSSVKEVTRPIKMAMVRREEPLSVINNSTSGDERAEAYRSLKEPLTHGGSQEQQGVVIQALRYGALSEPQALCRLAAIDSLRHFRDPQAVVILKDAYYRAGAFVPETATVIRCQVLGALGDMGGPAEDAAVRAQAVDLLVKVLREPRTEGPDQDRQQKTDEQIAAATALGKFSDDQGVRALVNVLNKEDDIALRSRAHESLVQATGRDLPADAQVWNDFMSDPAATDRALAQQGIKDRLLRLAGWSQNSSLPPSPQVPTPQTPARP